jgi:hypothetical protein
MGQNQSRGQTEGWTSAPPLGQQLAQGATNSLIKSAFTPPSATQGGKKNPRMSTRKNRQTRSLKRRS